MVLNSMKTTLTKGQVFYLLRDNIKHHRHRLLQIRFYSSVNFKTSEATTNSTRHRSNSEERKRSDGETNRNPRIPLTDEELRILRDRIIRVDHAGEYGANRIYAGQMAVLGRTKSGPLIQHMWDQEKEHLNIFERLMPKYRARPTALLPFWNVAGFVLGAGTALLGEKAAMACTVAVESTITEHYNNQIRELVAAEPQGSESSRELMGLIQKCRDEEQEHHDIGIAQDAEQAPAYSILSNGIKVGCKAAIWLSERI